MSGWVKRRYQRYLEIQAGADADEVRRISRMDWLGMGLMSLGVGLLFLISKVRHPNAKMKVMSWVGGICVLAGLVLLKWARFKEGYLYKPEPEEPPTLFPKRKYTSNFEVRK